MENGGSFTHGSTIATNAVIERKVGKIGMMCTKGFRDVLLFREGPDKNPFDYDLDYPEPFVPRYLTLPVDERINSEGEIETPLNEEDIIQNVQKFKEYGVEAIAVCFLWSVSNPEHEKKAKEIINRVWPEVTVVLSCEVNPQGREYRRFVAAAMDASLRKLVSTYARELNSRLNKEGYIGEIGMLNSAGGVMSAGEIVEKPLYSIDSGPAMAPVSGKKYAFDDLKDDNVVILDMGGTTFDVSCVIDGVISVSRNTIIGNEIPGISRVNVLSVGAGGGSIAWIDDGGMIRVGPRSAGSVPGPACYNRGGVYPTVTDANVVLGYINPDFFNNGRMKLYPELSYKAIKEHIADKLGISVEEAAFSIWATVNENMISAIKDITIWQGIDPRDFTMVAGGGACGLHAVPLSAGLEMNKLLIPRTAGGLSATGGVFSDIVSEYNENLFTDTLNFDKEAVVKALSKMKKEALDFFERNNISEENRKIEINVEGRYPYQVWELPIRIDGLLNDDFEFTDEVIKGIEELFHKTHEKVFSVKEDTYVECVMWRLKAIGKREMQITEEILPKTDIEPKFELRKVYFKEFGEKTDVKIYQGADLKFGNVIVGPAVIEEPTTTIVILPGYIAKITEINNYLIEKADD